MDIEEIYKETHYIQSPRVRGYLYNIIPDRQDADDIHQDVFFSFWQSLADFKFEAAPATLLHIIMRRCVIDYLRRRHLTQRGLAVLQNALENGETSNQGFKKAQEKEPRKSLELFPADHLELLLRIASGDTKALLLAIKKTMKRSEL